MNAWRGVRVLKRVRATLAAPSTSRLGLLQTAGSTAKLPNSNLCARPVEGAHENQSAAILGRANCLSYISVQWKLFLVFFGHPRVLYLLYRSNHTRFAHAASSKTTPVQILGGEPH